jgi:hypothetical protein
MFFSFHHSVVVFLPTRISKEGKKKKKRKEEIDEIVIVINDLYWLLGNDIFKNISLSLAFKAVPIIQ